MILHPAMFEAAWFFIVLVVDALAWVSLIIGAVGLYAIKRGWLA